MVKCHARDYITFDCGNTKIVREIRATGYGNYLARDVVFDHSAGIVELREAVIDLEEISKATLENAKIIFRARVDRDMPGGLAFLMAFERAWSDLRLSTISELRESITYLCPANIAQ